MKTLSRFSGIAVPVAAVSLATLFVVGCERPPTEEVQLGYRGVGQEQVVNPRLLEDKVAASVAPAPQPPAAPVPLKASATYPSLQVLGDLSLTEFNRLMAAISSWVAPPEQGCAYCHNLENMTSDEKYTKVVARTMIRMTQESNSEWKDHVSPTGVTCYTCHRGNPVPKYVWTEDPGPGHPGGFAATGQNIGAPSVGYTSLPFNPMSAFLDASDTSINVVSNTALPTGSRVTLKQTERTYGLMMYMSNALGVNCTYCHNSRAFISWDQSSPARVKAWYAIRHVRDINRNYILPLADILPASRKGPLGDPKRVACETCHQGAYKPMFGAPMLKDYPALAGPTTTTVAEPSPPPAEAVPILVPPPPTVVPVMPSARAPDTESAPAQEAKGADPKLTGEPVQRKALM